MRQGGGGGRRCSLIPLFSPTETGASDWPPWPFSLKRAIFASPTNAFLVSFQIGEPPLLFGLFLTPRFLLRDWRENIFFPFLRTNVANHARKRKKATFHLMRQFLFVSRRQSFFLRAVSELRPAGPPSRTALASPEVTRFGHMMFQKKSIPPPFIFASFDPKINHIPPL